MKKFLCIFLVVVIGVLSVVVIGFRSVGLSTGMKIIKLDYLMKSYDKEPNDETLAKIMVTSFSILAYTPLQEYGDIFFLSEDADAKYEAFVPEITKFIEKYDYPFNTPEECYDFMLVHYLTSYMYDLKTLEYKTNVEEFVDRFDKCIPRWNAF